MGLDSRLLIKQVEARPALWNREDKDYCHKKVVSKLWSEIALIHGVHESRVKSKWKALRDTFRQEVKRNPHKSAWNFYMDMQFIRGQLKTIRWSGEAELEDEPDDTSYVKTEPEEIRDYYEEELGKQGEVPAGDEQESLQMDTDEDQGIYDDDYHFLMSLLPQMRNLEPKKKLLLRIKIMKLFFKETHQQQQQQQL